MAGCDLEIYNDENDGRDDNNLIYVSRELAENLQEIRIHRGLTQNDLANEVEKLAIRLHEEENSITGLDISRIETQKKRRVKIGKIRLIEKVFDMKEGTLSELSTRGNYENRIHIVNDSFRVGGVSVNEKTNSAPQGQPMKINFCYNCGFKLHKPGMNFCPSCGEDLRA